MFVNAVATKRSRDISTDSIYIKLLSPDSARLLRIIRDVSVHVGGGTRAHTAKIRSIGCHEDRFHRLFGFGRSELEPLIKAGNRSARSHE